MTQPAATNGGHASPVRAVCAVSAALALLVLAGWLGAKTAGSRAASAPRQSREESLLPLPAGSEVLALQRGEEAATLHGVAPGGEGAVMQFFRVALADEGWSELALDEEIAEDGLLAFWRSGETCIIRVTGASSGASAVTAVVMSGAPQAPFSGPYEEMER